MINLSQVTKTYAASGRSHLALRSIDLSVPAGSIYGIIGGSGAGKSTLLRCINWLEQPTSGQVHVGGQLLNAMDAKALRAARQNIGMIFQHFNLLSTKTVFNNIALPLRLTRTPVHEIERRVSELLEVTQLNDYKQAYPHELSGGQKQRVAIARALAHRPKVLLSDEATSALDPQTTASILSLLKTINQRFGITILLITHDMDVIKQICQRVAVLNQGEIIEEGDVLSVFTQPQQPITRAFVSKTMGEGLPVDMMNRLTPTPTHPNDEPLLHLAFRGHAAVEPLIAGLVKHCDVSVNILQAHLESIQGQPCGTMTVALRESDKEAAVLAYLRERQVTVEVLGYVSIA